MSKISILHLSDVHFGIGDEEGKQGRVTQALVDSVKKHVEDYGKPDICVISGDLTQSGDPEQFKRFEEWLYSVLKHSPRCKVFIVPGNHEVQRPLGDEEMFNTRWWRQTDSEVQSKTWQLVEDVPSVRLYPFDHASVCS